MAAAAPMEEDWEPLPLPSRRSPFYSLKSIAFSGKAADGGASAAKVYGGLLPRIAGGGAAMGLDNPGQQPERPQAPAPAGGARPLARGLAGGPKPQAEVEVEDEDELLLRQLLKRRDAALADHEKLSEQLQQARERVLKEKKSKIMALEQAGGLRSQWQALNNELQHENAGIRTQQETLKQQRGEMRKLEGKDDSLLDSENGTLRGSSELSSKAPRPPELPSGRPDMGYVPGAGLMPPSPSGGPGAASARQTPPSRRASPGSQRASPRPPGESSPAHDSRPQSHRGFASSPSHGPGSPQKFTVSKQPNSSRGREASRAGAPADS